MLPYFDEYKVYLSEHMGKASVKTHIMRLAKLDRAEKNLLDMSVEEMFNVLEVDKKANATLNAVFGGIETYLKWLNSEYQTPIYDCFYRVKTLNNSNTSCNSCNYFVDFAELKKFLLKAEENYLQEQEIKVSEKKLDSIYLKQKMFNAYAVLLWKQMKDDEILALSLKETMFVITSKQIVVNEKLVSLTDDEVDFLSEAFDAVSGLHQEIKDRQYKSKTLRKRTLKIEVCDNLFNASNINVLKNLKWNALGNSISDQRLQIPNIIKAGIFYKLRQYEIENNYVFYGNKGIEDCSNLLGISISKAQRYYSEYNKFKRSLENKDKFSVNTI